ncbi:MAG: acyloxyacyl hydrolase, partial [Bacteroidales bacterium]
IPEQEGEGGPGLNTSMFDEGLFWEAGFHYGNLWPHSKSLEHLLRSHLSFIQLTAFKSTSGSRDWHQLYGFPDIGLGIMTGDLGYPQVLGRVWAVIPQVRIPVTGTNKLQLTLRHGFGLGYLTRSFDRLENYRNNAIGSHLNIAFMSRLELGVSLGKNMRLSAGVGLMHFSNGAVRKPNKGVNIPLANLGVQWGGGEAPPKKNHADPEEMAGTEQAFYSFSLAGGVSRIDHQDETLYGAFSLGSSVSIPISRKRRLGIGADLFLNGADRQILGRELPETPSWSRVLKAGVHLGYEQVFGRLDFLLHTGYYLHARQKDHGPIYNRIGFRYHAGRHYTVQLGLKTHVFTASYIELGAGFRFGKANGTDLAKPNRASFLLGQRHWGKNHVTPDQ